MANPVTLPRPHNVIWYCSCCRRWISSSDVTLDQIHARSRGGCGEFLYTIKHLGRMPKRKETHV